MRLPYPLTIPALSGLLVLGASTAFAASVPIANPSFEDPALSNGAYQMAAPTGWTVANGNSNVVVWSPGSPYPNSFYGSAPPGGSQVLALGGNFSSGEIVQTLNATLQANTTYTLSYWVGARYDIPISSYNVILLAGGIALAADHVGNPSPGQFVKRTIVYHSGANSGGQLSIDLVGTGRNYAAGVPGQVNLDMIQFDASPDSLSLACPAALSSYVGMSYSSALVPNGGKAPFTYSILNGSLGGLALDQNTGIIAGTPGSTGTFNFQAQVVDSAVPQVNATSNCSLTIAPVPVIGATFVKTDTSTQGTWKGSYGGDGYMIPADATSLPGYAQVTMSGQAQYVWLPSTQDVRAPQKSASNATDRIASTWYTSTSFTIDVTIAGSTAQPVSLYAVDWDAYQRTERVDVYDPSSNTLLDTRTASGFTNGVYLIWNVIGHVQFVVTRTASVNAVVSGIFFGYAGVVTPPAISQSPSSTSVNAGQTATFNVTATGSAPLTYQWQSKPSGGSTFSNIPGATGASYTTPALTLTDSGSQYRSVVTNSAGTATSAAATLTVSLAAPAITQNPASASIVTGQTASFTVAASGGNLSYQWQSQPSGAPAFSNIAGANAATYTTPPLTLADHLTLFRCVVTNAAGSATSAAASVSVAVPSQNSASFAMTDTTTQGTWKGVYGPDGFLIASDSSSPPAYAQVSFTGQLPFVWVASTQDPTTLQKGSPSATDRIASVWYSSTSFTIDVNLTGPMHAVALYALDWDRSQRVQQIDVLDGSTNLTLDSRMVSNFSSGTYLVWNVTGHVQFRITRIAGPNAVISGVFFGVGQAIATQPVFTQNPANASVNAGQTATFSALATGGLLSYQWQSQTPGAPGFSSINGANSPCYTTPTLAVSSSGTKYRCVVTNSAGTATSAAATLTVTAVQTSSSASFAGTDTTTQGAWRPTYGTDGYMIAGAANSIPAYAQAPSVNGSSIWVSGYSADPRAVQVAPGLGEIAAWYSGTQFTVDLNLTDSNTHRIALYFVDWGGPARTQTVTVSDAGTGVVLDSKPLSGFVNGTYLSWNIKGHVTVTITSNSGPNSVLSAVFFQ